MRVTEKGMRIDRVQATGALHSRTIENRMAAAKKARVKRPFFMLLKLYR
jgi:hypothetical protein